jgi:hypothetical protein
MDDPSGHDGTLAELEISTGIGEELDSLQAVSSTAAKRAFTAPIVDIYACMRKFYQTPRNQGDWPLHFWVYANQPGNKGLRYDIDFGGATSGAFTGTMGQLNVKPDTLQDVKNESWCYKVTSLNEVQYMGWNAFVGLDAATLGEVNAIVDKQTLNYAFEYWLSAGSPMIEHELSKVSNCLIFTIEASSEAKLMSMGR